MYGLKILDHTYWRASWSAEIGRRLNILNSTHDLFVFDDQTQRKDVINALEGVPPEAYDLVRLRPSTSGRCEFYTDSGQCYEFE